ncbi:hypothetical protein CBR_g29730 [Chara braunii]|uniref:Uncharacterized protein n=1 Tax=Chara braunii TaxID=69332 RepID=A0A388LBM7_CHABU|nr:hypothetical protein CBR_g29730 [Chara braunii]|eukprot:GBG79583.1 hypothetical protein CBR_g29730 [Chara braunii]
MISRDHDPGNYTKVLNSILRKEVKRWRRMQREQRRRLWWPLVGAGKGAGLGVPETEVLNEKDEADDMGRALMVKGGTGGVILARVGDRRARSQRSTSRVAAGRRFGSLVASQHIHMGLIAMLATSQWWEHDPIV